MPTTKEKAARRPSAQKAKQREKSGSQKKRARVRVDDGAVVVEPPAKAKRKEANAKKKDKKKPKKGSGKKPKKRVFTAKGADRHELYQLSVQSPEEDVKFLSRVYKNVRKKKPLHFREDFCGTALLASHWIRRGKEYTAEGFDIDAPTIAWGMEHNFASLGDAAERCKLHIKDVREKSHVPPDVRCAQNFSYFIFHERSEMLAYLKSVYEDLAPEGAFVMDIYGGPEAMMEMKEQRRIDEGFTYIWDQAEYWPATGAYKAYIHFKFKDGTQIKRAFTYDWRLWYLTEVKDLLHEVGFDHVDTYWEGTDEDGESGNGIYRKSKKGENCDAWVTYLVAYK